MRGSPGALGAIGIGALIGATVGLVLDPTTTGLWVIAALSGGSIAYAVYDHKATWKAIVFVFKIPYWLGRGAVWIAVGTVRMLTSRTFYGFWFSGFFMFEATTLTTMLGLRALGAFAKIDITELGLTSTEIFLGGTLLFTVFIYGGASGASLESMAADMRKCALWGNPVAIIFYWPVFGIINSGKVVKIIHNDARAYCFVYGTVGATVGYYFGQHGAGLLHAVAPLVGAIAGIVLALGVGMLNRSSKADTPT